MKQVKLRYMYGDYCIGIPREWIKKLRWGRLEYLNIKISGESIIITKQVEVESGESVASGES